MQAELCDKGDTRRGVYFGTFLIALGTLALEVSLTRLLSVIAWYYLAFFVVSAAMLGMTAGATTVYLKPGWFTKEKLDESIAKACLGFALSIPISLIMLCLTPMVLSMSIMSFFVFILATFVCALPFYFSGIAITAILTKCNLPIGKLYASDLIGASIGCLFVLVGLEILDTPSLILLCAAIPAAATFCFTWKRSSLKLQRIAICILWFMIPFAIINSLTRYGIQPFVMKGRVISHRASILEKWNSFSRVAVHELPNFEVRNLDGISSVVPEGERLLHIYHMDIDGAAGTLLHEFKSNNDIGYFRYDIANLAYYLGPKKNTCIIGVGGGKDIQSAVLFGQEKITGVDINPIFIDLLKRRFRKRAGIADRKEVTLVAEEGRAFLSRAKEKYSIIQIDGVDTWAATGAGAYSLSENGIYTIEAWKIFLDRLSSEGILSVTRIYNTENLGEMGRVVGLAVAALLESGIASASQHIALVTSNDRSTLLVGKQPFSSQDIEKLKKISSDLQFNAIILPGIPPNNEDLRNIISAKSLNELKIATTNKFFNYKPTTDDNPYFFNMLRLNHLGAAFQFTPGIMRGNLTATLTLVGLILALLFLAIVTIVFPLSLESRHKVDKSAVNKILWSAVVYFSLLGAGFMFVEIALVQRLSVFLGHPIYALGIVLFTIIASAGIGSFLSEHLPLTKAPYVFIFPIFITLAIVTTRFILPILCSNLTPASTILKILASVIIVVPMGILLGICFPTGMRLVKPSYSAQTPWYWALNGIFGVLCSALTVFVSIYFGISTNFYIASICYIMLIFCLPYMYKASQETL